MFPAVLPVAGLGTRSLLASKAIPKELLPVFDRPTLQWIVEEASAADVKNLILVTARWKSAIENHFDTDPELESVLERTKKPDLLSEVRRTANLANFSYIRQPEPLGLGHAIYCAQDLIQDSHFFVMLGDDLLAEKSSAQKKEKVGVAQLLEEFSKRPELAKMDAGLILLMQVPDSEVSKYGICEVEDDRGLFKISRAVEKPSPKVAPSRWAIVARYLLPRSIFKLLGSQTKGELQEIQLTDALNQLAKEGTLFGCAVNGERFDTGDRIGYLRANLHYYLQSGLKKEVEKCLQEFVSR